MIIFNPQEINHEITNLKYQLKKHKKIQSRLKSRNEKGHEHYT